MKTRRHRDPEAVSWRLSPGVYEAGLPLRFDGLFAGEERRRIALPGYPFQREHYWVEAPKRRRPGTGHPLLGVRHDSASGEISFDTELFPSDPAWLGDHRVFNRLVAPGALYGAMAMSACIAERPGAAVIEDFQMQSALVFPEKDGADGNEEKVVSCRCCWMAPMRVRHAASGS